MAGRKKLQPAQTGTDVQILDKTPEAIALQEITWRQADEEAVARAATVAKELLYEEELSIGALEDGIRLYQRRVVEDFLELGKRLLLLKELTPHGEFGQRTAALGFAPHAAQRFMRAAAKAAKSDKLSLLAGKVKNPAVFVELIALDDDTLEEFADMDDIESLSAPEARRRIRELRADIEVKEERATKREREIEVLQREVSRLKRERAKATPNEDATKARDAATSAAMQVRADIAAQGEGVSSLNMAIVELRELAEAGGNSAEHDQFLGGLIADVMAELRRVRDLHELPVIGDQGAADWLAGV